MNCFTINLRKSIRISKGPTMLLDIYRVLTVSIFISKIIMKHTQLKARQRQEATSSINPSSF